MNAVQEHLDTLIKLRNDLIAEGLLPKSSVVAFDRTIRALKGEAVRRQLASVLDARAASVKPSHTN